MNQQAILKNETVIELKKLARDPAYVFPALGFPILFYLLFAKVLGYASGSPQQALFLLANYVGFGAVGATLFGAAISFAMEREQGLLQLKRASPAPIALGLIGKLLACSLLSTAGAALLLLVATLFGVPITPAAAGKLLCIAWLSALPFGAIGLCIGVFFRANSAAGIINAFFLAGSALGGLWFPLSMLPKAIASMAPVWPMYPLGVLARSAVEERLAWLPIGALLLWAVLGLSITAWRLRRGAA